MNLNELERKQCECCYYGVAICKASHHKCSCFFAGPFTCKRNDLHHSCVCSNIRFTGDCRSFWHDCVCVLHGRDSCRRTNFNHICICEQFGLLECMIKTLACCHKGFERPWDDPRHTKKWTFVYTASKLLAHLMRVEGNKLSAQGIGYVHVILEKLL